jgi:DNA-binding transcriptional LysR family regulator
MDLGDLKVFSAVVQAGGVTRAAARLHRVPSNVTTRIKNLEEELGVPLFLREGKRMQVTPAGRRLFEYAQRLLTLAEEAREAMQETGPRGVLRLGSMESTAAARLPALLNAFQKRYPEVTVELHTGIPRDLIAQIFDGKLDAALVAEPVQDERLETLPVYVEELVVVGPARHRPIASPKDVAKRTLLAFEAGCPHRQRLEDWFARAEVAPERIIEMSSYHAMLGCAVAGMGVALMPKSVLDTYSERSRLSVHKLKGDLRTVRTLLVWRKDAPQAKIAAFAEMLTTGEAKGGRVTRGSHSRLRRVNARN